MEQELQIIPEPNLKERILSFVQALLVPFAAYALITALFGVFDHNGYPLLLMIAVAALFALTLIFGLLFGCKLNAHAVAALVFGLLQGVYTWINGISFLGLYVGYHLLVLSYAYFVLALFGNQNRTMHGGLLLLDLVKATFVYPFLSFASWFTSLFRHSKENKKLTHAILYTVIGIFSALILGVIVVALLSFDPAFKKLFTFDIDWDDVPTILLKLIVTVPVSALLFGAFTSSKGKRLPGFSTPEQADTIATRMKKLPAVVLLIPVAALLVIYGLFFFTQWDTYMSAFSGVLPPSFTAAEYARNGFFKLCAVAFINAALGVVMTLFMKESDKASVLLKKIANTLLALATLILIATALSKMILYIKRFDLTVLRLLTSVILIVIAIGFFVSILSQWIKRVKVMPVLIVTVSLILLVTPFCNVREQIAKYNVDAYLNDAYHREIDTDYLMFDLGSAAIPHAIRLYESGKLYPSDSSRLQSQLKDTYESLSSMTDPMELSLADQRALRALEQMKP